jgi:hypothetical protein
MAAVAGESSSGESGAVWLEHRVQIPLEQYAAVRLLLGNLAATHDVEVSMPPEVHVGEQPVAYNERKVIWVEDIGGAGHRPMIPLSHLMERANVSDGMAAMSLASVIRHEAGRALESGEQSDLLDFIHPEPAPSEWFQYDVQGIYADRALELAYGGVVLERLPGVSPVSIAVFREFCADLVQSVPPVES